MMVCLSTSLVLAGAERDPLKPRVPKDQRGAAKKMKSPLYKKASKASPEIIAEGKKIFEGKGTCFNCHGKSGQGDGPAGKVLNPGATQFHQLQIPQKAERWGIVLGDQEWQPGDRDGALDSQCHYGRRSLEGYRLRAELL